MLRINTRTNPVARTATAAVFALSALSLSACSDETAGGEAGVDVEDIQENDDVGADTSLAYDGYYDSDFYDDVVSYDGQQVTVSAGVNEWLSDSALTIAGLEDTGVEDLLVISAGSMNGVEPDSTVQVTGTVHQSFDLAAVEEEMGIDLDDPLFEEWDGEPYIEASSVDTSADAEQ